MNSRRQNSSAKSSIDSQTLENQSNQILSTTVDEKDNDFLCPICFEIIKEAYITRCGHTFCHDCILRSIETIKKCPKCNISLSSPDNNNIIPNYLLNELISKYIIGKNKSLDASISDNNLRAMTESSQLTLPDVNIMLEILTQRKQLLETESFAAQNHLLHEFLKHLLTQREKQKQQLTKEIEIIKNDIVQVETILKEVQQNCPTVDEIENKIKNSTDENMSTVKTEVIQIIDTINSAMGDDSDKNKGFNSSESLPSSYSYLNRKKKMHSHFDDFVQCYFDTRRKELYLTDGDGSTNSECDHLTRMSNSKESLGVFRERLFKFSKYSSLRPLATLNYANDMFLPSTIVSSIEFDKDNEFFAIAGVTKKIKIFDYLAVIRDPVDIHYPCAEMMSNSKISCVNWNSYHKNILASSDYEGTVTIWDAETGVRTKSFQEHDKRCWSVDFNYIDISLIASGSDDSRVKLWSLNSDHSIATIEASANVCCVKFNPKSSVHVAYGSADHCVHYYDLRNMKEALCVFEGHKKAVSYVKFLNTHEIISASTDSQLKLWNINTPPYCSRTFVGHVNEKNFVGLATDGDYISCGSEDNSLYIYYKGLSKQLLSLKLDGTKNISDPGYDLNEFVSAVCWRKENNVILAANSRGIIKILELV